MDAEKIMLNMLDKLTNQGEALASQGQAIEHQGKALDKHLNHGHVWRLTIGGSALAIIVLWVSAANTFGKYQQSLVNINEKFNKHEEQGEDIRMSERVAVLEDRMGVRDVITGSSTRHKEISGVEG